MWSPVSCSFDYSGFSGSAVASPGLCEDLALKCQLRPGAGTKNQVTLHLGTSTQLWCVLSLPKPNTDVMRQADARHFLKTSNFSEPSRGAGCWEQDCRLEGLAFGVACAHTMQFSRRMLASAAQSPKAFPALGIVHVVIRIPSLPPQSAASVSFRWGSSGCLGR